MKALLVTRNGKRVCLVGLDAGRAKCVAANFLGQNFLGPQQGIALAPRAIGTMAIAGAENRVTEKGATERGDMLSWETMQLEADDEIVFRIVEVDEADEPSSRQTIRSS